VLIGFKILNIMYAAKIIPKNIPDSTKLYQTIATNDTTAMTNAITGVTGNKGTLNGRIRSGSVLRNLKTEIIDMIYNINAPKTEKVMISPVLPASSAAIPMSVLKISALAGVRKRLFILPKNPGAKPTRPNSNVARPDANINP
jgi:hypothetical protein